MVDLVYLYFGINLRCVRRNRRFSQSRLGRRTDPPLSQELISKYERGLRPPERHVQALADALDVPAEELLRRPRIIRADGRHAVVVEHPISDGRYVSGPPRSVSGLIPFDASKDPEADQ